MIKDPSIFKVLDVSTGHMTEKDSEKLGAEAGLARSAVYELRDYGFLVYVGEIEENWGAEEMSPAFMKVLEEAKELDCTYVRFDRDGHDYSELEHFDW